jgi:HEAT repeat protein
MQPARIEARVTEMTRIRYARPTATVGSVPDGADRELASPEPRARAAAAAALGARALEPADVDRLRALVDDDRDARVRAAALAALVRRAPVAVARSAWLVAADDHEPAVRRRAVETAPALGGAVPVERLLVLLDDADTWVAEAAAFALGERRDDAVRTVPALISAATAHEDALVRESAIAALGATGDPAGLEAVLAGCSDKPAIRRRAVLALAAFDGPEVEAALARALEDSDWQVRQAAEDLLHDDTG